MQTAILHLSDIHFKSSSPIPGWGREIASAVMSSLPDLRSCIIVASGDIANTGDATEYAVAKEFFAEMADALSQSGVDETAIVVVPGNHDCNFRHEDDTRRFLMGDVPRLIREGLDLSGTIASSMLGVQSDFFKFEADLRCGTELALAERLYHRRDVRACGKIISFHCFNSAWLSRRHEAQGQLYLPPELLVVRDADQTALSIAVCHHPENWLNADNARALGRFLLDHADIVLTGHEHEGDVTRQFGIDRQQIDFVEAPALDFNSSGASEFKVLLCDLQKSQQSIIRFCWESDHYSERDRHPWTLARNPARQHSPFEISAAFMRDLTSPGTGFSHPRRTPPNGELCLRDLYVYPDLRHRALSKIIDGAGKPNSTVRGGDIAKFIKSHPRLVIYGAERAGKSSLAKVLYEDFRSEDVVPVLIDGGRLRGKWGTSQFHDLLKECLRHQYGAAAIDPFFRLPADKRMLIIDDLHSARIPQNQQASFSDRICAQFGTIVAFASDLFRIEELTKHEIAEAFRQFEQCDLREFGRFHRHRLIEKWFFLGNEDGTETADIGRHVTRIDKTIATLLGKNVLPHYPITILTLLQLLETNDATHTANGAYGYLYEVLIKTALSRVSRGPGDIDVKFTYLSRLAFSMFNRKESGATEADLRRAHEEYCSHYDIIRDYTPMLNDLKMAGILEEYDGSYRFKYRYIYYYSVAKFIQENLAQHRSLLENIADHIYNETNANILIFVVYLTRDADLIRRVVSNARVIYDEYDPCDMQEHVSFINAMYKEAPPPLVLGSMDIRSNRDEYNRRQDIEEDGVEQGHDLGIEEEPDYSYDRQLQDVIKINIAIKTIQILGQIIRNFPGSLDGRLKADIVAECYALGLRTLRAILSLAERDIPGLRQYIGSLIAERTNLTEQKLADRTEHTIIWLMIACAFGIVKKVSYAVGHPELTATYERVLTNDGGLAVSIIDIAVKLDHYEHVPVPDLRKLRRQVSNNHFSYTVVRDIVWNFLYLYPNKMSTIQSLCSLWEIEMTPPKILENRAKKG